jgi:hypothetical protein
MRTGLFSTIFFLFFLNTLLSQPIKKVSAYDNNYDSSSGIIGITDNGVYEYSWYYDEWLQIPNTGLCFIDGQAKIDEVSAFDNNSLNPSGIYVISDTAVFVYNYYSELWYDLKNNGLERIDGKVQLSDLSAHYVIADDDVDVYVKSGDYIYYYEWYLQQWYQLSNSGISKINQTNINKFNSSIFPNPLQLGSTICYNLPSNHNASIRIAVFSEDGKFIKEICNEIQSEGEHKFELNKTDFPSGIYYYEISGVNFSHSKKFISIE